MGGLSFLIFRLNVLFFVFCFLSVWLPRGRRCVSYCVLQIKLASGLKNLRFFNGFTLPRGFQEAPRGAPACQQRATAVSQARHKRVTGVPPFSFQRATAVSCQLPAVSCQLSAVS